MTKQAQKLDSPAALDSSIAGAPEVEITAEMIKAGASVLWELEGEASKEVLAQAVYLAMVRLATSSD